MAAPCLPFGFVAFREVNFNGTDRQSENLLRTQLNLQTNEQSIGLHALLHTVAAPIGHRRFDKFQRLVTGVIFKFCLFSC